MKYKKLATAFITVLIIVVLGYWFFMKTVRGNSLALYIAAGWGAPLGVRWECAEETDTQVENKFQKPLNFDPESKNLLKNFWYYSYYRGCLFKNGYTFKGEQVKPSVIIKTSYENYFAGLQFDVPEGAKIMQDNLLDVNTDDRMFISLINTAAGNVRLLYFTKHDQWDSVEHINALLQSLPGTQGKVIEKTLGVSASGPDVHISQDDGSVGIALPTADNHLIIIFGPQAALPEILNIEKTLKISPRVF